MLTKLITDATILLVPLKGTLFLSVERKSSKKAAL